MIVQPKPKRTFSFFLAGSLRFNENYLNFQNVSKSVKILLTERVNGLCAPKGKKTKCVCVCAGLKKTR